MLAAAFCFWASSRSPTTPEGLKTVEGPDAYSKALADANQAVSGIFERADAGDPLSDADKAVLLKTAPIIDSANRFAPQHVSGYLGSGKCYLFAGNYDAALQRLQQAADNELTDKDAEAQDGAGEVCLRMSQVLLGLGRAQDALVQAKAAEKINPSSSDYQTAEAAALIKLGKLADAGSKLRKARQSDPTYRPAETLQLSLPQEDR